MVLANIIESEYNKHTKSRVPCEDSDKPAHLISLPCQHDKANANVQADQSLRDFLGFVMLWLKIVM